MKNEKDGAQLAALELFPNGQPNANYCWEDEGRNERERQDYRDHIAAIIRKHCQSMESELADALRMVTGINDDPANGVMVRLSFDAEAQIKDVLARYTLKTEGWK